MFKFLPGLDPDKVFFLDGDGRIVHWPQMKELVFDSSIVFFLLL